MNCKKLRNLLVSPERPPLPVEGRRHLEDCASCGRFAARLRIARQVLVEHRADVEPDAAFAARVASRLPKGPAEILGWAAARLIPATLVLALVLGWFALRAEPAPVVAEEAAPTDDLVSWVLDRSGEGR
jgi:hypothetical protein